MLRPTFFGLFYAALFNRCFLCGTLVLFHHNVRCCSLRLCPFGSHVIRRGCLISGFCIGRLPDFYWLLLLLAGF